MGPKLAPRCAHCQTGTAEKWHNVDKVTQLCSTCHARQERDQQELERELKEIQSREVNASVETPETVAEVIGSAPIEPVTKMEVVPELVAAEDPAAEPQVGGGDVKEITTASEDKKEPAPATEEVKDEPMDDKDEKESSNGEAKEKPMPSVSPRKLRKNVRSARKGGTGGSGGNGSKSGRSRRFIFKKHPMKAPTITVTTRTVETLFHNNIYYQIGDIVSVMDAKDNTYYAQIRGLQIDSYCEKSAYITWLIPTTASPPANERFDPATYLIGPEEDLPRKLNCMEFVMHAPSSYYLDRHNPFPRPESWGPENTTQEDNSNFIWANISHLYQC